MADNDDTARRRGANRNNLTTASMLREIQFPLSAAFSRRQTYATRLFGTTLAAEAIHQVLDRCRTQSTYRDERQCTKCGRKLLSAEQANGLRAALHFLREYVASLVPE